MLFASRRFWPEGFIRGCRAYRVHGVWPCNFKVEEVCIFDRNGPRQAKVRDSPETLRLPIMYVYRPGKSKDNIPWFSL